MEVHHNLIWRLVQNVLKRSLVKGTYNAPSSAVCVVYFFSQNTLHAEETVLSSPRETTARPRAPKTKSSARGPLYEFLQATD
jgi:hypothetical protein